MANFQKNASLPLTLVGLAIVFSGGLYVVGQQILRQSANDPQIQMAEDAAAKASQGETFIVPAVKVDVASSLAPFMIVFDTSGSVTQSSGLLHGVTPSLPAGVLDKAKKDHELRFTWQPESGVRLATVVVASSGDNTNYILASRNMGEVERREDHVLLLAGAVLVGSLIIIFGFMTFAPKRG